MDKFSEIIERLLRVETRVVRGFAEMGIDVTQTQTQRAPVCLKAERRIVLRSLDITVANLFRTAVDNGMEVGYDSITVEYDGTTILRI
jgi:hypothetical protein